MRHASDHNLAGVENVMGALPPIDHHAPLDIHVLEETRLEHYVRKKITFSPEPRSVVYAWLADSVFRS